ncbi:hypothetical protein JCM10212_003284 [Sporobolomyces blumeae]
MPSTQTYPSTTSSPFPDPAVPSASNGDARPGSSLSSSLSTRLAATARRSPSVRSDTTVASYKDADEAGNQAEQGHEGRQRDPSHPRSDGSRIGSGTAQGRNGLDSGSDGLGQGQGRARPSGFDRGAHPTSTATASPTSRPTPRSPPPPAAHPHVYSPRPTQGSTLKSTASAFDYDDLLGPRPGTHQPVVAQTSSPSTASTSVPPAALSNPTNHLGAVEDASGRLDGTYGTTVGLEEKLQGLGFASTERVGGERGVGTNGNGLATEKEGNGKNGNGMGGTEESREDEVDESWLGLSNATYHRPAPTSAQHYPSPQRLASTSHPSSSSSRALSSTDGSPPTSHSSAFPSTNGTTATTFGSPLSPLVAPFSPGSASGSIGAGITGQAGATNPWANAATIVFGARNAAREREASWNSTMIHSPPLENRGAFPSPALRTSNHYPSPMPGSGTDPFSSSRPYSPSPSSLASPPLAHRYVDAPSASSSFPLPPQFAAQASNMPFTPPPSHSETYDSHGGHGMPNSKVGSREASGNKAGGPSPDKDKSGSGGGYVRAPYSSVPNPSTATPTPASTSISATGQGGVDGPAASDEISTLFIVGFPDDLLEREFQNFFLFANGFEGATLKVPAPTNGSVVPGSSNAGGEGSDGSGGGGGNSARTSLDEPYPAYFEGGDANGNGVNGSGSGLNGANGVVRKQTIGFARFRTRRQALDALDVINGRKVDVEKGSILKAEMAKKNLHTKRSSSQPPAPHPAPPPPAESTQPPEPVPSRPVPSVAAPVHVQNQQAGRGPTTTTQAAPAPIPITTIPGSGPSIPLSALDSDTLQKLANSGNVNPAVLAEIARQNAAAAAAAAMSPKLSTSSTTTLTPYEAFHSVPYEASQGFASMRDTYFDEQPSPFLRQETPQQPGFNFGPHSPPLSSSPPRATHALHSLAGNNMLQQLDEGVHEDALSPLARSSGPFARPSIPGDSFVPTPNIEQNPSTTFRDRQLPYQAAQPSPSLGYTPTFPAPSSSQTQVGGSTPSTSNLNQLVPAIVRPQTQAQQQGIVAQQHAQLAAAQAYARTQNPADMNAPKNTLYVGGLPAVLPSLTGPFSASHLEDSLRNAFSRCPGFKRLQFRSKSNGPIVFVEFEDTAFATKAMNEMYGYTLGGLVKGGIRLSYSKNPLGVRSNGLPSGNPPPMPMPAHLDPNLAGYASAYAAPYASPSVFDPHRRHPDPLYGSPSIGPTASSHLYTSAPTSTVNLVDPRTASSMSQQPLAAGQSQSQATTPYGSGTPSVPFGSTFSPFAEY